jgi:hypothetical protein
MARIMGEKIIKTCGECNWCNTYWDGSASYCGHPSRTREVIVRKSQMKTNCQLPKVRSE